MTDAIKSLLEDYPLSEQSEAVTSRLVKQLGNAYEESIGYNPFKDDPSITVEQVYQTLKEYWAECEKGEQS